MKAEWDSWFLPSFSSFCFHICDLHNTHFLLLPTVFNMVGALRIEVFRLVKFVAVRRSCDSANTPWIDSIYSARAVAGPESGAPGVRLARSVTFLIRRMLTRSASSERLMCIYDIRRLLRKCILKAQDECNTRHQQMQTEMLPIGTTTSKSSRPIGSTSIPLIRPRLQLILI